jgi:hypothetical protein
MEVRVGAARIASGQDPLPVDRAVAALAKAGYPAHLDPNDEPISRPAEALGLANLLQNR